MAGIYEQIISQLFKAKLERYDRKIYHITTTYMQATDFKAIEKHRSVRLSWSWAQVLLR